MKNYRQGFASLLFIVAVLCSLISQRPDLIASGDDGIFKLVWVLPGLFLLMSHYKTFFHRNVVRYFLFVLFFVLYCLAATAFSTKEYVGADMYNVCISFAIFCVSYVFWTHYGSERNMRRIVACVFLCCCYLAFVVYVEFLMGYSLFISTYVFSAKNSMGQILLCGILLGLIYFPKQKVWQVLYAVGLGFIVVVMFLMKSRATIAGFACCLLYLLFQSENKRFRIYTGVGIAAIIVFLCFSPTLYDNLVNGILLNAHDATDVNSVSSGRVGIIADKLKLIPENLVFGVGNMYVDCMPIDMVLQFGIVGAGIVFSYLGVIVKDVKRLDVTSRLHLSTTLLIIAFFVNSLFEAQPPFGPGVKCFLLWMMLGFSLAERDNPLVNKLKSVLPHA